MPAEIRALVDAKPGTRLVWSAMPDGTIIVRAKTKSILEFRKGPADFAHCLHVALAMQAGEQPLWTFDKEAAKVSGAQLLNKT